MRYYFRSTIDRPEREKWYLFLFLLIWLGVNLIQAAFTELIHDEAYYWMYSRNLAWGYFDHPPVIALLIKAGYSLFPNELGVRLFTALMGTLTLMFIYLLQDKEKRSLWLYILLTTSIVLVYSHVGGFLAIPDIPVVFFSAFFLLLYKKYLNQDSLVLAALLGIVAALMLYSKYHAVLVLGFTLLAYLKIVKRKTFWIIPLVIILVLMPHLFWQIHNGFPTFQYHLVGRSSSYQFDFTFNYLYSQLLIAGPLVAITVLYAAGSYRPQNTFDRILKINFLGVLLFFFLASFKGRVEAHWTAVAYIPLLVLAQKSCLGNPKCLMWLQRLYLPGICLFIFLRIALIVQIFPPKLKLGQELHNWDQWAKQVDSVAGGRMVVFASTFQRPAKYSFYTKGKFAHSLNSVHYRKNQYDIWPFEDSIQHQRVMLIQGVAPKQTMYTVVGEKYGYEFIDDYGIHIEIRRFPHHSYYPAKYPTRQY